MPSTACIYGTTERGRDARGGSALLNIGVNGTVTTALSDPGGQLEWVLPSPDGRHLALVQDSNSSNVWLLENL